jgi:hypothetical protein
LTLVRSFVQTLKFSHKKIKEQFIFLTKNKKNNFFWKENRESFGIFNFFLTRKFIIL